MFAATLARLLARDGYNVLAVDADPSLNLGMALGVPKSVLESVTPLSENRELIESRVRVFGGVISLTPRVDDVVDLYGVKGPDGVKLLVMGTVRKGGSGCLCPENAFLRALLSHLLLRRRDFVVLDMVAGLEHLGRGTARGVDLMVCIVEPSLKSIETAKRISKLAKDIGVKDFAIVGNKVVSAEDEEVIRNSLGEQYDILGIIPFDENVIRADILGKPLLDHSPNSPAVTSIVEIKKAIIKRLGVESS